MCVQPGSGAKAPQLASCAKGQPWRPCTPRPQSDKWFVEQRRAQEPRHGAVGKDKGELEVGTAHSKKHKRYLEVASESGPDWRKQEEVLEEVL